jgi:hypothetical protein
MSCLRVHHLGLGPGGTEVWTSVKTGLAQILLWFYNHNAIMPDTAMQSTGIGKCARLGKKSTETQWGHPGQRRKRQSGRNLVQCNYLKACPLESPPGRRWAAWVVPAPTGK